MHDTSHPSDDAATHAPTPVPTSDVRPRSHPLRAAVLAASGALLGALGALALTHRAPPAAPAADVRPSGPAAPALATGSYDAARLERMGVRFARVGHAESESTVDVMGVLDLDRERVAQVSTHAAGRLASLRAVVGQTVRRGDVLARVESPAIGEAAAEYWTRQAELRSARAQLARLHALQEGGLATRREIEVAEAQARTAQAGSNAAQVRLQAYGVSADRARAGVAPLTSPIDGVVIRRTVVLGSWVQPEEEAFTIADLSALWAELDVYEGDVGLVSAGDPVTLDVPSLGVRDLPGRVQYVYPELDASTRMGKVRVTVPNPDGRLRAGLSIAAHIHPSRRTGMHVPVEAVREREGAARVLLRRGDTASWVPVHTGERHADTVEITGGLEEGSAVAVSGLALLEGAP